MEYQTTKTVTLDLVVTYYMGDEGFIEIDGISAVALGNKLIDVGDALSDSDVRELALEIQYEL